MACALRPGSRWRFIETSLAAAAARSRCPAQPAAGHEAPPPPAPQLLGPGAWATVTNLIRRREDIFPFFGGHTPPHTAAGDVDLLATTVLGASSGGGTGLLGLGRNGVSGNVNVSPATGGTGGSGGSTGAASNCDPTATCGGSYGGGGGMGKGGDGACRIIWGDGRAFLGTNTADV